MSLLFVAIVMTTVLILILAILSYFSDSRFRLGCISQKQTFRSVQQVLQARCHLVAQPSKHQKLKSKIKNIHNKKKYKIQQWSPYYNKNSTIHRNSTQYPIILLKRCYFSEDIFIHNTKKSKH